MEPGMADRVASELRLFDECPMEREDMIGDGPLLAAMVLDMHEDAKHDGHARFCRWAACREAWLWT